MRYLERVNRPYVVRVRFSDAPHDDTFGDFEVILEQRAEEAGKFYAAVQPPDLTPDERLVQRKAFDGLMWSK